MGMALRRRSRRPAIRDVRGDIKRVLILTPSTCKSGNESRHDSQAHKQDSEEYYLAGFVRKHARHVRLTKHGGRPYARRRLVDE